MNIFTNKDIQNHFVIISSLLGSLIVLSQLILWFSLGVLNLAIFMLSFLIAVCILSVSFLYFRKQDQMIEGAITQINLYLSGKTDVRIDCYEEGSLYKLFHSINTLATALDAQVEKEQKGKEFMKGTISDISHQLKTPLAALNIYNGLLQDETGDLDIIREFSVKSEKEIDRIEMLVQSLLKITKIDAGSMLIEKSLENIEDIINDVYQQFEFRANQEGKTILISGIANAQLFCDRNWISEAISNIVKNALDHTDAGDQISIEWKRLPAVTQIIVRDNGSGIHPEDMHHIFKRFYRSRFSKDRQGIGLGLPLAKAIVEAHDGNITVDSVLGEGSVFVINIVNLTKM
jgi:signal transduction histidine kinase